MHVHKEDKTKEQLTTLEYRNGSSLIIISMRVDGVTPEMFDWYQRDMPAHLLKYNKMIQMKLLER